MKSNFIDKVLNLDEKIKHVGTGQILRTLVGTRKEKYHISRFYIKDRKANKRKIVFLATGTKI